MDVLSSFFASVRWQDGVDILLNSFILFRLYVLFRGTHVMRVVAGIALLWVFQRVAVFLGLIVTSWVMQGIIAGAALIIIIVFRNEIRSVLQARNLKAILWGFTQKSTRTPVETIIESVYLLARKRIGAILVLPGTDDLQDLIQNQITWNGLMSTEMLLSIFWPDNPVHDGAAVIQGRRVTHVGAILPLSKRDDFPSYFGTRHRAAVGLAENSDALTIVVSEERGQVMVAKGGDTFHIHDNLELEQLLRTHMGTAPAQRGGLFREDRELKLAAAISVLFVTGIWFSFARGMETLITLGVPVEYMNSGNRMEIIDASVNGVSLSLSGSGTLIKSLHPDQVKVKLDLGQAVVGKNTYTITKDNVVLPPGILLKKVDPAVVQVNVDRPETKSLPIQSDWVGKLADDLIMQSVTLIPESIMVAGGSLNLQNRSTVYTEKIPLDGIRASGQMTVRLALHPGGLKAVDGQPDKVVVKYSIIKRKA
jgi:diadenylate cyclase